MTTEQVDNMLKDYKRCSARCMQLSVELELAEEQLHESEETMLEDACIKGQTYNGMPHGADIRKPTEDIVIMFNSGYVPKYIKVMREEIGSMKRERNEMKAVKSVVEAWMIALTDRERFVIQGHVIEGRTWREMLDEYEEKFGQFSKEGMRKLKIKALSKIYDVAGC